MAWKRLLRNIWDGYHKLWGSKFRWEVMWQNWVFLCFFAYKIRQKQKLTLSSTNQVKTRDWSCLLPLYSVSMIGLYNKGRRVQFGIFLNQGLWFEYTQLLPGVEMILLIPGTKRTPLISSRGRRDSQSRPFLGPRRDETLVSVSSQAFTESQSRSRVSKLLFTWSQSQSRGRD